MKLTAKHPPPATSPLSTREPAAVSADGPGGVQLGPADVDRMLRPATIDSKTLATKLLFHPAYNVLSPWAGLEKQDISEGFLAAKGHSELLRSCVHSYDVVFEKRTIWRGAETTTAHINIRLRPDAPHSAKDAVHDIVRYWPSSIPVPTISVFTPVDDPADGKETLRGTGQSLLRRLTASMKDDAFKLPSSLFTTQERNILKQWAKNHAPRCVDLAPGRQFLALWQGTKSFATEEGKAAHDTLTELGVIHPFVEQAMAIFEKAFGASHLKDTAFVYNGHATTAMTTMMPVLRRFGLARIGLWTSARSGRPGVTELMRLQKPDGNYDHEFSHAAGAASESGSSHIRPIARPWHKRPLTLNDFMTDAALNPGSVWHEGTMVVDKLGPWLRSKGNTIPRRLFDGGVRIILHNRDDHEAAKVLKDHIWGADLASSLIKALEARFIGEQFALLAQRTVREQFGKRIGDTPVIVKGNGLLGGHTIEAMIRQGMDPKNITVIDINHSAQARARELGCTILSSEGSLALQSRPKEAVLICATPEEAFGPGNCTTFADHLAVLSMTSGGKGVDTKRLRNVATEVEVGKSLGPHSKDTVADMDLLLAKGGRETRIHLVAGGEAANLADEMWMHRYQVTSMAVVFATLQAISLSERGVFRLDPEVDSALIQAAKDTGLFDIIPLECREIDNPEDLRRDLEAFTPTGSAPSADA